MPKTNEARKTHGGKGCNDVNGAMPEDRFNAIFRKDEKKQGIQEVAKK